MIGQLPVSALRWLIRKAGAYSLISLSLLFVLFLGVASGLSGQIKELEQLFLLPVLSLGLLVGWWLARLRISGFIAAPVAVVLGATFILLYGGNLVRPFSQIVSSLVSLIRLDWLWRADWSAVWLALIDFGNAFQVLSLRFSHWISALLNRVDFFDPTVSSMLWSLSLWLATTWASWCTRRWGNPLLAALPAAALLAGILNYTGAEIISLLVSVGSTLFLVVLLDYHQRETSWEQRGFDYSYELRVDLGLTVTVLTAGLLGLAWIAPSLSVRQIVSLAQDLLNPAAASGRPFAESLGLEPGTGDLPGLGGISAGELPRSHLVGSGPELTQQLVMTIRTGELPPMDDFETAAYTIPRYYWRALSYDFYTGTGWGTSATRTLVYQPYQPSLDETPSFHRLLRQEVERAQDSSTLLFSTGILFTTDHAYQIDWRYPPGSSMVADIFGAAFSAGPEVSNYQVESLVPEVQEAQLQQAGDDYPTWIRDHYLELPASLPERVRTLALNITADSLTPFERARAVEAYLRSFPYTLDLPQPPLDRDLVDYFLFDIQKGYCDYYASAMVVLARAAGLPARLVVGYATGQYDPLKAEYRVSAADAHSWPEIYFPGYGWIEFEPTAGLLLVERSHFSQGNFSSAPAETQSGKPAGETARFLSSYPGWIVWLGATLLLVLLSGAAWFIAESWRVHHSPPDIAISSLYAGFRRNASQLPIKFKPGDTPLEFLDLLNAHLHQVDKTRQIKHTLKSLSNEANRLTEIFNQSAYSPRIPGKSAQALAIQSWRRLRWRLWLVRLLYR